MKKLLALLLALLVIPWIILPVLAGEDELQKKQQEIEELEKRVTELQKQKVTLSSQIAYMDGQIRLTTLRISQTEEKIKVLAEKIGLLETSLDSLAVLAEARIEEAYKRSLTTDPILLLFSSRKFSDFVTRLKYLKVMQAHDKKLILAMEKSRISYDEQKKEVEALKKELEGQKKLLAQQKQEKEYLLKVTKNDERHFQELLARARAELEAIQSILAGKGEEKEVGGVSEDERIAAVISGLSACSTGTHLHFEVVVDGAHRNPEEYFKPISLSYSYNIDEIPETMNPRGSWSWPMDEPITVTQIYGMSYWARVLNYYRGGPHTGIDIKSSNLAVKSVKAGTLYRGSIACGGGTLRYVRVKHNEGNLNTYYLHVNYYK